MVINNYLFLAITIRVDTEVAAAEAVVEEATTENADHHPTTKTDHVTIGHVHVLILHVSLNYILVKRFDISTLSDNPVFF